MTDVNKYVLSQDEEGAEKRDPNPTLDKCPLTDFQNLRVVKFNINQIADLTKLKDLEFLLELQCKENIVADLNFLADTKDTLKFL